MSAQSKAKALVTQGLEPSTSQPLSAQQFQAIVDVAVTMLSCQGSSEVHSVPSPAGTRTRRLDVSIRSVREDSPTS